MNREETALGLFMAHRPALVNYANTIVSSRMEAEELVQEAWLRFDRAFGEQLLEDAAGYLYRIVRNLALDDRRRKAREGRLFTGEDFAEATEHSIDPAPGPETVALFEQEYARMLAALQELPERTRIAFEMHHFGDARLREIAAVLNISLPLAHRLVARAVQHCKRRLGQP